MPHNYPTQGDMYEFKPGERENVAKLNAILREAFDKLMEAKKFVEDCEAASMVTSEHGTYPELYWSFDFDWETDANGDPKLPCNYNTDVTIDIRVNDEWMSSTNFC